MMETHRKVVARYLDGRLVKGYTFDFGPAQARFHIFPEPSASGTSTQVFLRDLKALFFVRDLVGDPARQDAKQPPAKSASGRLVEVRFRDGETIVGTAEGSWTDSPGFFLVPADEGSNNLRVYVPTAATRAVYPWQIVTRPSAGSTSRRSAPPPVSAFAPPLLPGRLFGWLTR